MSAFTAAVQPSRWRPGALRRVGFALGAVVLAVAVAEGLRSHPPSAPLAVAGGIGLVGALALAVWRLEAAVWLGIALMLVVKFEPAPTDGVLLVVMLVAAVTGRFVIARIPTSMVLLSGAFLVTNVLSLPNSVDFGRAAQFIFITFYLVFFGLWLAGWTASADRARIVVRAYVFAAVVSGVIGVLAFAHAIPGRSLFVEYEGTRIVGLFKDPNVFGAFLVPAALIVVDEILTPRHLRSSRRVKVTMFLVLTLGAVFSFSRAAWISLGLGIVVLVGVYGLRRGGIGHALAIVTATVVAFGVVGGALAATHTLRFLQQRAQLQSYDSQRFGAQAEGLRLVQQHPFGIGPGQFEMYSPLSAHSTYVRATAEEGVPGIVVLGALFLGTLVIAGRNVVLGRETFGIGSAPLLAAWVGLIVSSFVIDTLHWRHLWLVAALIWAGGARR